MADDLSMNYPPKNSLNSPFSVYYLKAYLLEIKNYNKSGKTKHWSITSYYFILIFAFTFRIRLRHENSD